MRISIQTRKLKPFCPVSLAGKQIGRSFEHRLETQIRRALLPLLITAVLAALPVQDRSQSPPNTGYFLADSGTSTSGELDLTYIRPPPGTTLKNFTFDAFGPYALMGTVLIAGLDQATNTPPEWKQGLRGYAERFGSDFGIAVVGTTTRFGLAAAFKEDTSFYPCECRGLFPRLRHAAISTVTARRGEDGHRVFSIPALVAPYVGATGAVYGWYPNRFSTRDAFRMGNYSLLESVGGNIALEFLYRGPHSLLSRIHLKKTLGARVPGSNQ